VGKYPFVIVISQWMKLILFVLGKDIGNLICNVGSGVAAGGGGAAAGAGAEATDGGGEATKEEAKKEESEEESDDDMGFGEFVSN
jgi:ribosomal protein L12E/L44/L45/RPP1/RPP2